jgi:hypothetical protein
MGGPVPVVYPNINKMLVIVGDEAEMVKKIFGRHLELGSVKVLATKAGVRTKNRTRAPDRSVRGAPFGEGQWHATLRHLKKGCPVEEGQAGAPVP